MKIDMDSRKKMIVTKQDCERLERLCCSGFFAAFADKPYLQWLQGELHRAEIVEAGEMPPDVVTMNSTVRLLYVSERETETYTLVYPQEADIAAGKLSILAPEGTAILGHRVGDRVRWESPCGSIGVRIEELVFQPERDEVSA